MLNFQLVGYPILTSGLDSLARNFRWLVPVLGCYVAMSRLIIVEKGRPTQSQNLMISDFGYHATLQSRCERQRSPQSRHKGDDRTRQPSPDLPR